MKTALTLFLASITIASAGLPNIPLRTIDGVEKNLTDYDGKVMLIVNVASECGYTDQYGPMQALHAKFAEKGLRVVAVPSNDFGGQEPGTNADIKAFCAARYQTEFDLLEKTGIKENPHPLYAFLTEQKTSPSVFGPVGWNFEKFLVSRDGTVVNRWRADVSPDDPSVVGAIEWELADAKGRAELEKNGGGPGALNEYMGRKAAKTMSYHGANWLIRRTREKEESTAEMVEQLGLKPGMNVADIGSGNGYHTITMAKIIGEKGKAYAVDVQPEMLTLLDVRAREAGVTNIVPIENSYWDAKLPENSVDLALMVDVYHEFSHPAQMLASIRKSLRPGGRIALVEFRLEDKEVPIKLLHKMSKEQIMREYLANGFKLVESYDQLPWQHLMFFEATSGAEADAEGAAIFNGEDLNGWTDVKGGAPAAGWVVEEGGILHRKEKAGDLYSAKEYGDFELELEWKIVAGCNSGVKYRMADYSGKMLGPEFQIIDDGGYKKGDEKNLTASLYDVLARREDVKPKSPGEWNHIKIVAKGTHFEHWLNGEKVLETDTSSDAWKAAVSDSKFKEVGGFGQKPKGRIMLQEHGGEVWFRNIVLREAE